MSKDRLLIPPLLVTGYSSRTAAQQLTVRAARARRLVARMVRSRPSPIAIVLISLGGTGCLDPTGPGDELFALPSVRPYVVGAALANLDANGHFRLPAPVSPDGERIISTDFAGELALGFVRTWISNPRAMTLPGLGGIGAAIEEEHGAPIDWEGIHLTRRVAYFAVSPFAWAPAEAPVYARRYWGPHFLVPLYVDGRRVGSVSVAARSTDLWIDNDGFVRQPLISGNEFFIIGVRRLEAFGIPLEPEIAVEFAARSLHAKVVDVPTLVQPGGRVIFLMSRWRLDLDRVVRLRRKVDNAILDARQVFVGLFTSLSDRNPSGRLRVRLMVPAPTQPALITDTYSRPDSDETVTFELPRFADLPVEFDEVYPVGS